MREQKRRAVQNEQPGAFLPAPEPNGDACDGIVRVRGGYIRPMTTRISTISRTSPKPPLGP
jgi:hypothetical protein